MDHQAIAQLLGNYGEFVGAIVVVITLGYLVVQVNQNTKALKTNIHTNWVGISADTHKMTSENASLFGEMYYSEERRFSELSPAEKMAHFSLFHHTMNTYEAIYLSYLEGVINESQFDSKRRNIMWFMDRNLNRQSWDAVAHHVYDQRFIDYVNELLEKQN